MKTEEIMGTLITVLMPLLVLQIKEMVDSHKHRTDLALKQARRDESISIDISALKSTIDKNATVLDEMKDDLLDVKGRVIKLEWHQGQR